MEGLLDADILQYEVSFAAEAYWKYLHQERGEPVMGPPPWEVVEDMLEGRVEAIMNDAGATGDPFLFFTGKNNFRHHIARIQPYKQRDGDRPWHYKNVKAHLQSKYKWIQKDWLEADDLIGIAMSKNPGKYICITRDKDLRMLPGHHYGWEVGKQPSYGPRLVEDIGFLQLSPCRKKITGGGLKFFYYQLLKGDSVDTIPGIPGFGVVTIFSLLGSLESEEEMLEAVSTVYEKHYGDFWKERLIEVGRLLNMVREERNDYKEILLWNPFQKTQEWMNVETGEISG